MVYLWFKETPQKTLIGLHSKMYKHIIDFHKLKLMTVIPIYYEL